MGRGSELRPRFPNRCTKVDDEGPTEQQARTLQRDAPASFSLDTARGDRPVAPFAAESHQSLHITLLKYEYERSEVHTDAEGPACLRPFLPCPGASVRASRCGPLLEHHLTAELSLVVVGQKTNQTIEKS